MGSLTSQDGNLNVVKEINSSGNKQESGGRSLQNGRSAILAFLDGTAKNKALL